MSAVILAVAFLLDLPWLAGLVGVNLLVSAFFGTRLFLPGRAWPIVRRTLKLGPTEPEHEYPPRFAQALGGTFLALAGVAFLVGAGPLGWLLVGAVAALQTLLAATGICVGCRLYFLRWFVPRCSRGCSVARMRSPRSRSRRSTGSADPGRASARDRSDAPRKDACRPTGPTASDLILLWIGLAIDTLGPATEGGVWRSVHAC